MNIQGKQLLLLFLILSSITFAQTKNALSYYKERGDNAYTSNLFKKAFEYYSEYLKNEPNDFYIKQKAAQSGLYCLKNNIVYDKLAYLIPLYFSQLSESADDTLSMLHLAEAHYYSGLYYNNEMPFRSADSYINSLQAFDKYSQKQKLNATHIKLIETITSKIYSTIAYKLRVDAYNTLIDNISDLVKSGVVTNETSLALKVKQNVLDGYVESNNLLIAEGEHHFVNKTVEDIQLILKELDSTTISSFIMKESFFVFNNFKTNDVEKNEKLKQARAIKSIADKYKNTTPTEVEKKQYWNEYVQNNLKMRKKNLILKYGDSGTIIAEGKVPEQANIQMCIAAKGNPLYKVHIPLTWGNIDVLLYQHEEYYIFENDTLIK